MNSIVRADKHLGTRVHQLRRRQEQQLTDFIPSIVLDVAHVLCERVRMHRDLGVVVGAE
jgi:hypothetical protein